jgi:Transglycosylase SLT domain
MLGLVAFEAAASSTADVTTKDCNMADKTSTSGPSWTAWFGRSEADIGHRLALHWQTTLGVLLLLCLQGTVRADIWGFVDSERMPHFAPSQLDSRYELLLRDSQAVEPFHPVGIVAKTSQDTGETGAPDGQPASLSTGTEAVNAVSPKLLAFFERSENYKAVTPLLREASKTHGIDYSLLKALITAESGFNPSVVSPKGAVGLMQLIPPTAERYGVTAGKGSTIAKKLTDPKINIKAGARYLADLIRMFPGRLELAIAAYNAGEGAVQRAGNRIPNYPETQNYVRTVMQLYNGLTPQASKTPGGRVRLELKGVSDERGN